MPQREERGHDLVHLLGRRIRFDQEAKDLTLTCRRGLAKLARNLDRSAPPGLIELLHQFVAQGDALRAPAWKLDQMSRQLDLLVVAEFGVQAVDVVEKVAARLA